MYLEGRVCGLNSNGQTGRQSTISDEFTDDKSRNCPFTASKLKKDEKHFARHVYIDVWLWLCQ